MSFGNRQLDRALDRYLTQTPEEYYHEDDIEEDEVDAWTRCDLCGQRVKLIELKKHKEEKHGKKAIS
jgi:hypothetical protein